MKIAIDARESGTTTGRYMDKLIAYLHDQKSDFEFTILTKKDRLDFFKQIAPNFTTIEAPYKEFTLTEQLSFLKQIQSLKPDLVHFTMIQQPVLYGGKVVTTMHDLTTVRFKNPSKNPIIFWVKQQIYKLVIIIDAHKSAAIITISNFVKKDIVKFTHIDPRKITVTYEASDRIGEVPEEFEPVKAKEFIMYIGRPLPHKNLQRLIDAFAKLQKTQPGLYLVLAGKKDILFEDHERYVQDHHISNVIFAGFISEGQLRWLYEHCAAYVVPSLSEGFGLPGLEAMAHGAPVVCSNASCLPEIYGDAAHYFDPTSTAAMVSAINDVLTDKVLRQKLVSAGQKQVKKYSWHRMAEQTLAIYKQVLS